MAAGPPPLEPLGSLVDEVLDCPQRGRAARGVVAHDDLTCAEQLRPDRTGQTDGPGADDQHVLARSQARLVDGVEPDRQRLDRRAVDTCRGVVEVAMRAHRRQKAGDNMGCSVVWIDR